MTTYNCERFIDQTLSAVASQNRRPDQIVIVDDASADNTVACLRRWQKSLDIEVVVQEVNGGVARARNAGACLLKTDLVAVLDGDDVILPNHLEVLTSLHDVHGGIISPLAKFWVPGRAPRRYQRRLRGLVVPERDQLRRLIYKNYVFVGSLVARKDFESVRGYSEAERSQDMTADWDLWLRLVAAGCKVTQATTPTVLYRVSSGSMADDATHMLECELAQLERSRRFMPTTYQRDIDRAIANREAELIVAKLEMPPQRLTLARLAVGRHGGDLRNRARSVMIALASRRLAQKLRQRGTW